MLKFSANISIMFQELPFIERFAAARKAGFRAVECWFPYEHPIEELHHILDDNNLHLVGLNTAPGNITAGEWGLAGVPGRERDFEAHFQQALDYAIGLHASAIHVMAAMLPVGADRGAALSTYRKNLGQAVRHAAGSGVTLVIEPLNARDRPGYLLAHADEAIRIIDGIGAPNLKLMFDIYHIQIMEGDIITRLQKYWSRIGHIQIASVPRRAEPDEGELDYCYILGEIDRLGWNGFIGCEYKPRSTTLEGLSWFETLGYKPG